MHPGFEAPHSFIGEESGAVSIGFEIEVSDSTGGNISFSDISHCGLYIICSHGFIPYHEVVKVAIHGAGGMHISAESEYILLLPFCGGPHEFRFSFKSLFSK